jgi:hypothetical protein
MTSPVGIGRILAAGLLMEAPASAGGMGIQIRLAAGESREQAVLRVIKGLAPAEAASLKSHVDWIQDYGFDDPSHDAPRGTDRTPADAMIELKRALAKPVKAVPASTQVQQQPVSAQAVAEAPRFEHFDEPFLPLEEYDQEDAALQAMASAGVFDAPAAESERERMRG